MQTVTIAHAPERSSPFYVAMATLMLALLLTTFLTRYFLRALTDQPPLPLFVHVHALLFTVWIVLFLVQATLIRADAVRLHRKLGVGGMLLAVAMTVVGFYSAFEGARRGHDPSPAGDNPLGFMIVPFTDILLFAGFVAAAWVFRRQREAHKRLILLATIGGFAWPIIIRFPPTAGSFPLALGLLALLVLLAPLKDALTRRRLNWVDVLGGLGILLSVPARGLISRTDAWQRLAAWLIQ